MRGIRSLSKGRRIARSLSSTSPFSRSSLSTTRVLACSFPCPQSSILLLARRTMVQGISVIDNCIINTNPATGEEISRVPCTTPEALDQIMTAASQAQRAWANLPAPRRVELLRKGLAKLGTHANKLASLSVQEMGKPLAEAKEEVHGAVHKDDFMDILETSLRPQQRGSSIVVRHALGIVAVLSPWNFPVDEILLLALPALASGNCVVVKPSEVTPETGACVVDCLASVLPPGVLQLAQGDGTVGAQLVAQEGISMIAMTGSSATGKKILQQAAPQMKRLVLELGGKDPMIVFADADLGKAAVDGVKYSLSNTGQVCCSIERIYVADEVYEEFQELVTQHARTYKVGNGMDEGVNVGPLVSALQRNKVKEHVEDAVSKGAKVLYKSEVPHETGGTYYPATVLADVTKDMVMYRDETFGPVVALTPFGGSEEEAITLANDTEYGLASSVYSQDAEKAQRVASLIQAGQVGVNCYALEHMDVACPWVGHKKSGSGYHSGVEGFHQFSIPKTIIYSPAEKKD